MSEAVFAGTQKCTFGLFFFSADSAAEKGLRFSQYFALESQI